MSRASACPTVFDVDSGAEALALLKNSGSICAPPVSGSSGDRSAETAATANQIQTIESPPPNQPDVDSTSSASGPDAVSNVVFWGKPIPPPSERNAAQSRLTLPAPGLGPAEEFDLPDGSRLVFLLSTEMASRNISSSRCMILPPGWGLLQSRPMCLSYASLICQALFASRDGLLSLSEIYHWIQSTYPAYDPADSKWKNSVRHNLSAHREFCKVDRDQGKHPGKGQFWTIPPDYHPCFVDGIFFPASDLVYPTGIQNGKSMPAGANLMTFDSAKRRAAMSAARASAARASLLRSEGRDYSQIFGMDGMPLVMGCNMTGATDANLDGEPVADSKPQNNKSAALAKVRPSKRQSNSPARMSECGPTRSPGRPASKRVRLRVRGQGLPNPKSRQRILLKSRKSNANPSPAVKSKRSSSDRAEAPQISRPQDKHLSLEEMALDTKMSDNVGPSLGSGDLTTEASRPGIPGTGSHPKPSEEIINKVLDPLLAPSLD